MADNSTKRCPQCSGEIDFFGSCRKCGREWSEHLEEGEQARGLPEGQEHTAHAPVKKKSAAKKSRFTKSKPASQSKFAETPARFQPWMIELEDDETEIIRKRSLMHLDSRKIYNAMGLALRAHEAQKASLLWLTRLWEFLPEEEKKALAPTLERLKVSFAELRTVASAKTADAAQMEIAMEKAHRSARRARLKQMDAAANKRAAARQIMPGEDTEGMNNPDVQGIDPKALESMTKEQLIELAKTQLANLDQEKSSRKKQQFQKTEDPETE